VAGGRGQGGARGQSMVELAIALPVFLFVLIGAFQLLLTSYAQQVAVGAAQGGARLAASGDAAPEAAAATATARADELLRVGLGQLPESTSVDATWAGDVVVVDVSVSLAPLVPLTDRIGLTRIRARSRASRELFRPGGGATAP